MGERYIEIGIGLCVRSQHFPLSSVHLNKHNRCIYSMIIELYMFLTIFHQKETRHYVFVSIHYPLQAYGQWW